MQRRLLAMLVTACFGCGARSMPGSPATDTCGDRRTLDSLCVGAPTDRPCDGACVTETACKTRVTVGDDAALQKALGSALPGTCILLAPGAYGEATVPPEVNLLGAGPEYSTLSSVETKGTATLENLVVGENGIVGRGGDLTLRRVRVGAGSSIGVQAIDVNLTMLESTVASRTTTGVLARCKDRCGAAPPKVTLAGVKIADDALVGVLFAGVNVSMRGVEISHTLPSGFTYGRGIELQGCQVDARGIDVHDSADVGVILIESAGQIGPLFEVSANRVGVYVRKPTAGELHLVGFDFHDNAIVSLGLDDARSVLLDDGHLGPTLSAAVPTAFGSSATIGDGLVVGPNCGATVTSRVRIEKSGRRPVIVDASATGRYDAVLMGDDASIGVLVQGGSDPGIPAAIEVAPGTKTERKLAADALPTWPAPAK